VGCHASGQAVARPSEVGERRQTMATAERQCPGHRPDRRRRARRHRQDHNCDIWKRHHRHM